VLASINHDDIVSGIAALETRIAECEREEFAVESELISLRARASDPNDVYTKLDILNDQIAELESRQRAYALALSVIDGATENLREGVAPRLGQYATDLMSVMTDKRYTSFSVSDGMKVTFSSEDGSERSVDFLSGGTRDLAYVAVRMALVDMLYTEKPPICFDETFAHQDNTRARSLMRSLAHLAEEGYQSFVFTCRAREGVLANDLAGGAGVYKLSVAEDFILD
jgi:DNA repair exonuclease SbcCD ATPase subunit